MVDGLLTPQGILVRDSLLYIVDAGSKAVIAVDLATGAPPHRRGGASGRRASRGDPEAAARYAAVLRSAGPVRRDRRGT